MKKLVVLVALFGLLLGMSVVAKAEEVILFDFEKGLEGWEIPDWAFEKPDHAQKDLEASKDFAKTGSQSLKMTVDFPGGRWTGGIVETMQYFDWTAYNTIAFDMYIPADAPLGLKAKMILTVGDAWKWIEMSKEYPLVPGEWVTVKADLLPGSIDWRRIQVDDAFRQDVRKLDIRVVSDGRPAYTGPVYIDNIRVMK
jgi:hypothetical protein